MPTTPMTAAPPARRVRAAGVETFLYDAGAGDVPLICVHGVPDSADAWRPLLDRAGELGRVIAPDLPCFGRSERPAPDVFDSSVDAYVRWFDALLDELGVERYRLIVHDWGSIALAAAALHPERVERVVAINVVPLSSGYRWHWLARLLWRPRVIGEVGMTVFNRFTIKLLTRLQRPGLRPLDAGLLDRIQRDLDPGMRRAILALYRSADPGILGRLGAGLRDITAPALVLWGRQDPYVGIEQLDVVAAAFGGAAEARPIDGGHWPMLDSPQAFEHAAAFLAGRDDAPGVTEA